MPAEGLWARAGRSLSRLPRWGVVGVGLAMAVFVGLMDYETGTEISLGVLYLAPVLLAAWLVGAGTGAFFSILCASLGLGADLLSGHVYAHPAIPWWNSLVRLAFFLTGAALARQLRLSFELEKKARDAAEASSRLKSEMVSMVSHELGNGLAVAGMSLFLLKESEPRPDDKARAQYYELLRQGHANLKTVVSNFLNLARLESGKFQLEPKPTELRSLVNDSIYLLGMAVRQKKLRLVLDFPEQVVPVMVDRDCMALVLNNLVGNAIKYTPSGGSVAVRLRPRQSSGRPEVTVSIEDSGIGFSSEEAESLLGGFHRTKEAKSMTTGFGVGLKVCRELVAHHGSRLMLESSPGRGSRFYFDLPVSPG